MGTQLGREAQAQSDASERNLERRVKLISGILAPTTVLTALLFYNGSGAGAVKHDLGGLRAKFTTCGHLRLQFPHAGEWLLRAIGKGLRAAPQ